jgi:hypothetical protein
MATGIRIVHRSLNSIAVLDNVMQALEKQLPWWMRWAVYGRVRKIILDSVGDLL